MSTTQHTPGKWKIGRKDILGGLQIINEARELVAVAESESDPEANAARIVACVNACEQLEDPGKQIPEMIGVLKQFWQASESGDLDRHDWNALEQVLLELGVLE